MLHRMIDTALRRRYWVFFLLAAASLYGLYAATHLPIDALPDITGVQVMVNATTGALSPEEIETDVTRPLESEFSGLKGVREIRSLSKYGLSQVTLIFNDSVGPYFARQLISERMQTIASRLPPGVGLSMGPLATGLGEVLQYALRAKPGSALDRMDRIDRLTRLRTIQDFTVKPELKTIPGVEEVDSIGGLEKRIYVNADPLKMARLGIDMDHLSSLLQGIGTNTGGGFLETPEHRYILRSRGRLTTLDALRRFPLRLYALGNVTNLGQIADVRMGGAPRMGAAVYAGKESVVGTVMVRSGSNSRAVAEAALRKLKSLRLPTDIEAVPLYSQSYLVNAAIRTVKENLFLGAGLVVVILLVMLRHLRGALIVALAIPLSMLFAASGMYVSGISANLMSLGAVDFGLIVDGSVVMVENILRRMAADRPKGFLEHFDTIASAAKEVAPSMASGVLVILIVYLPILGLGGLEGRLFAPMAKTVVLALTASLFISLFAVPALALLFLRGSSKLHGGEYLRNAYEPILRFSLRHKGTILIVSILTLIPAYLSFRNLGQVFLPHLDEGDVVLSLTRPAEISLPAEIRIQKKVNSIIAGFPEVEKVFTKIGSAEMNVDPNGLNLSDTFLILKKDRALWRKGKDGAPVSKARLVDEICSAIHDVAESEECTPEEPIGGRFNDLLEGSRADVALRIYGNDLEKLLSLTENARTVLEKIPGVEEVQQNHLMTPRKSTVMEFRIDPQRMNREEVRYPEVNRLFRMATVGSTVGYFYDNDLRFPVVLRLSDAYRHTASGISLTPVEIPGGGTMPLGSLGGIEAVREVTTIGRNNGRRYASVGVFLRDRDLKSFVDEAKEKIDSGLTLPPGFHLEWGGQFKNLEKAKSKLAIVIPATFVLVFVVLLQHFGSIRQTLAVLLAIPFGLTGGVFSLYFRGIPFSISAEIGFIALAGVAVLNGTVLVGFFNHLRKDGMDLESAVVEGTLVRLRPVLMTALVAGIGFIPMAFNTGTGAEVQRPLATVVIGGLLSSTILTLLVLPGLYLRLERDGKKELPEREMS